MKIDAPPDRIAGIGRFIGTDGEITFFQRGLDGFAEINERTDLFFVDFLDDRTHLPRNCM